MYSRLLERLDRQVMSSPLVVLVARNGYLIFHSVGDAIWNRLVVLWRQQYVCGAGPLLDERYRDTFFGTRLGAFLVAGAVRTHGHVTERIFKCSGYALFNGRNYTGLTYQYRKAEESSEQIQTHTSPRRRTS